MPSVLLPAALEDRLRALAIRVRRIRLVRGASFVILLAVGSFAVLLALDAAFQFSVLFRCLLEAAALAGVGFATWRLVGKPAQEDVPHEELARRLEAEYPELSEQLLTLVSLQHDAEIANGSPQLVSALARDTHQRTADLDFNRPFPFRPVAQFGALTLVALIASIAVGVNLPGERLRRAVLPWHRLSATAPFDIIVTSGDSVVRRGDPVTVAAYLKPRGPGVVLPEAATLLIRDAAQTRKLPMTGDATATFHATQPNTADDFEYRIESGAAASEWHTVRVADPVELMESSSITIAPPGYVKQPARTIMGISDIEALQYSTAQFHLRFNRPAESAQLEWRPDGRNPFDAPDIIPVEIGSDPRAGEVALRIRTGGALRIVLMNENGPRKLRSETALTIRAVVDAPPRFEQVTGVSVQPRTVRPGERVLIDLIAIDDLGISSAEIEYVAREETRRVPIPMTGNGTTRAEGRMLFDLPKASEGELLRYRLRIHDTRRVDDAKLGPQAALYPADSWCELKFSQSAPPLDQQEIFGVRDSIRTLLAKQLEELKQAHGDTQTLRTDTAGRSPLPIDHGLRLTAIRDRVRQVKAALEDGANGLAVTPELRSQAASIREIADGALADVGEQFRKAATDNAVERAGALATALARLQEVIDRLAELVKQNDRLAQDRLDRRRLEALAVDQESLADRANTAAARDELFKQQSELLARLKRLFAESDPLKKGSDAAAAQEAAKLAAEAQQIAALLRDLDAAADRTNAEVRSRLLRELRNRQATIVDTLAATQSKLETPARLIGAALPKREDFDRVARLIQEDKGVQALTELERLAQALDGVAAEFDRWAAERHDPKAALQQLIKWQDDLRLRFSLATKGTPFERLADEPKQLFRLEQEAIAKSVERLKLPLEPAVITLRETVLSQLNATFKKLHDDGQGAAESMAGVSAALAKVAEKLPSVADRLSRSRQEVDKLRLEQDVVIALAEPILRQYEKQPLTPVVMQALVSKLGALQPRQQKLAERLAVLDLPGLEGRQTRAAATLKYAASDLNAGLLHDVLASLTGSKRELDRLKLALDNHVPSDERAEELAHKQAEILRMVQAAGERATSRQLEPIHSLQDEVARQLGVLDAPEAPSLLNEARESVKPALRALEEFARGKGSNFVRLLGSLREATDALTALADRMTDREVERDRVRRLAGNRRQAVCLARQLAGRPLNPDASGEARRELGREVEELLATRVGAPGQAIKRRVLDGYFRLQAKTEPDRQAAEQKQLAEALAELAASMEDVELTSRPITPPAIPDPAEAFLPSRSQADSLRDLARQERELRARLNGLGAEMVNHSKPAEINPLAAIEEEQRALATAVELFARTLTQEKDASAESANKAAEAARMAADRLAVGDMKAARDNGERAAMLLRRMASDERPWAKAAAALAAKQDAILSELPAENAAISAAQQKAQQEALAKKAFELAHMLELAGKNAPAGDPGARALAEAAQLARQAESKLADAAKRIHEGQAMEAAKLRAEADRLLRQAADKAAMAGGPAPKELPDAAAMSSGEAARDAERSMQRAVGELGAKGDASAAEAAMRRAAESLNRAAKSTGRGAASQPSAKPGVGMKSNGNSGGGAAPITTANLTLTPNESVAKSWGELPGEVKAKFVQDLQARYGEDYARAIKFYFEQLADQK